MFLGVDPSLNSSAFCLLGKNLKPTFSKVRFKAGGSLGPKLVGIYSNLDRFLGRKKITLAVIEGGAYGAISKQFTLGQAAGVISLKSAERGIPLVTAAPATMKKCIAGHGRASKEEVLAAVLRFVKLEELNDLDKSDALGHALLAAMVYHVKTGDACILSEPLTRDQLEICRNIINKTPTVWPGSGRNE